MTKNVIDDGEHIIEDGNGHATMKILSRTSDSINRKLCDLEGEELWSVVKRPEGTYELYSNISFGPPVVVQVSGTPQKPKPHVSIRSAHPRGPNQVLKFKGNLMTNDYHILLQDSRDLTKGWVKVASSSPIEGEGKHAIKIAAGISVSMIPALCIVLSEIKEFLTPDLSSLQFNPPVAVFDQEQITQKKTVLTPVVRKGTIAVIDCNMNTIVSRDPCDIGKGLFCNSSGEIAFNFEQRGPLLCIPLRESAVEHNQGFIVFSKSKACRGARDILVSRVQSLKGMDCKRTRKENCFLLIRIGKGYEGSVIYRTNGRPKKCIAGQPIGKMFTVNKGPEGFSEAFKECRRKIHPDDLVGVKHLGVSATFAAGVDLVFASTVILAAMQIAPKLGTPSPQVPVEIMSEQLCCKKVLDLDDFD